MNFWQSIFGVSLGYLRDKTRYRHVLGGIVVVSLHHRCTKIDFHHINMSRTAFVGLCLFVWQTTERFFVWAGVKSMTSAFVGMYLREETHLHEFCSLSWRLRRRLNRYLACISLACPMVRFQSDSNQVPMRFQSRWVAWQRACAHTSKPYNTTDYIDILCVQNNKKYSQN